MELGTPMLLLRAGKTLAALPVQLVRLVCRPLAVSQVAGAPAGVAGLCRVVGQRAALLKLGFLLEGVEQGCPSRWVCVQTGAQTYVLEVDEVLGVRTLAAEQSEGQTALSLFGVRQYVRDLVELDQHLVEILDATRLLPAELDLGSEEEPKPCP